MSLLFDRPVLSLAILFHFYVSLDTYTPTQSAFSIDIPHITQTLSKQSSSYGNMYRRVLSLINTKSPVPLLSNTRLAKRTYINLPDYTSPDLHGFNHKHLGMTQAYKGVNLDAHNHEDSMIVTQPPQVLKTPLNKARISPTAQANSKLEKKKVMRMNHRGTLTESPA